jgi:ribosome maturation factor RimP
VSRSGGESRADAAVVDRVRGLAARIAISYGLEVFDVLFRREAHGMVLRVQIDRPGPSATAEESVGADVSRDLSAVLDVEAVIPTAYTLEVSSPGLDRPLRDEADYRRFTGRLAKVITQDVVDGQTFFRGVLDGVEREAGSPVLLLKGAGGRVHRVPLDRIKRANLEVEF